MYMTCDKLNYLLECFNMRIIDTKQYGSVIRYKIVDESGDDVFAYIGNLSGISIKLSFDLVKNAYDSLLNSINEFLVFRKNYDVEETHKNIYLGCKSYEEALIRKDLIG